MTAAGDPWPRVPPEVPPPRRPDRPDEPGWLPSAPPVPLVAPGAGRPRARQDEPGLLQHRMVLLFGPLEHDGATRAAAQVMTLDAEGDGEITLHLACEDGELLAALMLAETIDLAVSPVIAIARGVLGGVALAPFAAADRLMASRRASLRMSEPEVSLSAATSDVPTRAQDLLQRVEQVHSWVAAATGQPPDKIADDMQRGLLLDAAAARDYGLLDEILDAGHHCDPQAPQ